MGFLIPKQKFKYLEIMSCKNVNWVPFQVVFIAFMLSAICKDFDFDFDDADEDEYDPLLGVWYVV